MRKILGVLLPLFLLIAMVNPAYAVLISAGSFDASGTERIYDELVTLYTYTAPPGKSVMRIQGTVETSYEYNRYGCSFYIYGASGNLIASCYNTDNTRSTSFNKELNETSITIKAETLMRSCTLDWNATISLGADVADNTYAIQARDAANAAKASADTSAARSLNSYNAVSNTNGNTITAVRDASGTVLSEARQAKTNAANASNNAWYNGSAYGGSAQSVGNVAGYIAYSQLPAMNSKIDNLSTTINNLVGADNTPPEVIIKTVSGAQATSGNHIRAVVNAGDNVSTAFWYSLDGTVYDPLPADGEISLPVYFSGNNLITVWVKDEAGNVGRNSINIRKLGM